MDFVEEKTKEKLVRTRQIGDSDMRQLRQSRDRTTAGTISLIRVLFIGPSCACFCSIDEWRHATKHRLKIDAPCELDDQSKRERGSRFQSLMAMCARLYDIVNLLNEQ